MERQQNSIRVNKTLKFCCESSIATSHLLKLSPIMKHFSNIMPKQDVDAKVLDTQIVKFYPLTPCVCHMSHVTASASELTKWEINLPAKVCLLCVILLPNK